MRRLLTALLFSLVLSSALPVFAQQLTRGPYLQQGTTDSMTVVWRTDAPTDGLVKYGTDPQNLDVSVASASTTQHEVLIDGLSPDARYYYSVGTPDTVLAGGDSGHFFETQPTVGSADPFRFWVVGDSGTGGTRQKQVRDAMLAYTNANPPDIYLHVGDMAYNDGEDGEFQSNFFDIYQGILKNTVTWPAMGNHEGRTSDSDTQSGPYYDAYVLPPDGASGGMSSGTEAYYSFDYANVHFVVLDSHDSPRETGGAMLTWLEQDLAATDQEWIIAYWHHPAYTKGSHDSDSEGRLIDMRENALPILESHGVDLVLAGHSHIYERSYLLNGAYDTPTTATGYLVDDGDGRVDGDGAYQKPAAGAGDGTLYVVAGHGGTGVGGPGNHPVMFHSETENGSCIVDVDGSSLHLTNIRFDGIVTDEVTLVKGDGVVLLSPRTGESIVAGEPYTIRWAATGSTSSVDLELSIDDGQNWQTIASDVSGNSYEWDVPVTATPHAHMRITDAADAAKTDANGPFLITDQEPQTVIPMGSVWKYDDTGTFYIEDWRAPEFDDSEWPEGPAQLGYGDGDEATTLTDADPNIPSVLFRHHVNLSAPVARANYRVLYDDSAQVWINGKEVGKHNMPPSLGLDQYSGQGSDDNEIGTGEVAITPDGAPFVEGDNVIAVLVKQRSEGSSDLSFDFELTLTYQVEPPDVPDMGMGDEDAGGNDGSDAGGGSDMASGGSGDGGTPGSDGRPGGGGPDDDGDATSEGCSCRTVDRAPPMGWMWGVLMLLAVGFIRSRRSDAAST